MSELLSWNEFLEVIRPAIEVAQRFEDGPCGVVRALPEPLGPTVRFRRPVPFEVKP